MTRDYTALTDKEKQTLRLLLVGHDAKSIARQLGLSVHTVNERLRDARRKMSVSSSREAARLLGDAEADCPQFSADDDLGDDAVGLAVEAVASTGKRQSRRLAVQIIGAIAMLSLVITLFALSTPVADAPAASAAKPVSQAETAVTQSARRWLALVDAGDWSQSWQATGQSFRKLNTVERWASASQSARVPLGKALTRVLVSEGAVPTPPAGNMVVKFQTSFADKAGAFETVALVREDGDWRVVGYYID